MAAGVRIRGELSRSNGKAKRVRKEFGKKELENSSLHSKNFCFKTTFLDENVLPVHAGITDMFFGCGLIKELIPQNQIIKPFDS